MQNDKKQNTDILLELVCVACPCTSDNRGTWLQDDKRD